MAGPAAKDLAIYQGDYFELQVSFFEADGETPKDLTGLTLTAQIRQKAAAPDELVDFDIDIADPEDGVAVLSLSSEDTAALPAKKAYWDLQSTDGGGRVRTYLAGVVVVTGQVTR